MSDTDNYYRRRAEEELDAAAQAADPGISQIHREMARRYRGLLNDGPVLTQPARSPGVEPGTVFG